MKNRLDYQAMLEIPCELHQEFVKSTGNRFEKNDYVLRI